MNEQQLIEANQALEAWMPWALAISAGIVLYNFFMSWVYNRQAKALRS